MAGWRGGGPGFSGVDVVALSFLVVDNFPVNFPSRVIILLKSFKLYVGVCFHCHCDE